MPTFAQVNKHQTDISLESLIFQYWFLRSQFWSEVSFQTVAPVVSNVNIYLSRTILPVRSLEHPTTWLWVPNFPSFTGFCLEARLWMQNAYVGLQDSPLYENFRQWRVTTSVKEEGSLGCNRTFPKAGADLPRNPSSWLTCPVTFTSHLFLHVFLCPFVKWGQYLLNRQAMRTSKGPWAWPSAYLTRDGLPASIFPKHWI